MTHIRPLGVPVDPAVTAAEATYDAALETAMDAAQERHHVDRNTAWWIAKATVVVRLAARDIEKAIAKAWVAAFWRHLTTVED